LKEAGVRAHLDDRDNYSPGWKYGHWELKGVPVRIEVGPKDIAKKQVKVVKRNDFGKSFIPWTTLVEQVKQLLETIHDEMFKAAKARMDAHYSTASTWEEFMGEINKGKVCLTPFCEGKECEEAVQVKSKEESVVADEGEEGTQMSGRAKSLCMPLDQEPIKEGEKCFLCGKDATKRCIWGRSY